MRNNSKQVVQSKPATTTSKPASKPASKGPSQVQSKKVEVQKVIMKSDGNEIKDAFELFDANEGRINAREIRMAMQNIGFDEKNPGVYEVMTELDNPRNKNLGGATFNDFCQTVNNRIPERETTEDLRKVFNLFLDDPNATTTSLASIKRVADELGENIEELELSAMLNKASKSGDKLTFEDFVAIMTGAQN
jgi:Ca2+-binding EF-hand superfamily protein